MADVIGTAVKSGGKLYPAGTPVSDIPSDDFAEGDQDTLDALTVSAEEQEAHAKNFDRQPGAALSTMQAEHDMALTEEHEAGNFQNGETSPDGGKEQNPSVGNALSGDTFNEDLVPDPDAAPETTDVDGPVDPDDYSRDDLVAMAEAKGLSVPSGANKTEIADLINGADEE